VLVHTGFSATATLNLVSGKSEPLDGLSYEFAAEEAGTQAFYYSGEDSYVVRVGDSTVFAGTGPVVTVTLAENLDCESFLFERVLTHGLASALRRAGAFELHCAAVTDPETEVSALIVGPSGAGKSTLALQLAASGWHFSSDDVVLLAASGNIIEAFGLRNHFALTRETITRSGLADLHFLLHGKGFSPDNKLPLLPQDFFSARQVQNCVPKLLIFAHRIEALQSKVEPLDQAQAMKRLLRMCPWAFLDQPVAGRFLSILEKLCRQCCAFELHSGTDLLGNKLYTASFISSIINQHDA